LTSRKSSATTQLVGALGENKEAAITAALEAVNERLAWDTAFQQTMRQKYEDLEALSKPKAKPDLGPVPKPMNPVAFGEYNPYGRFDPYQLLREYGPHQLRAVLVRGTPRDLREAVDLVRAREPSTKPASRTKKADMIDYIVEYVAGPGY
jgi:hypothetical protein